jgi:exopolysaccharide biosynthesis polyprenyl glycosylphosphotransferase
MGLSFLAIRAGCGVRKLLSEGRVRNDSGTDDATRDALEARRASWSTHPRASLVRQALIAADLIGLSIAFVTAEFVVASSGDLEDRVGFQTELYLFLATLPVWVFVANLYRLYDHDETRADHSTVDEIVGVFHLVTVGAWLLFAGAWFTGLADPNLTKITAFWALAILMVTSGRALARTIARRRPAYEQSALIIGAGHVGQLVARKLTQHPEYRITVVGFVDDRPRELRPEVANLPVLGSVGEVPQLVRAHRVDRVIVAFLMNSHAQILELIRQLAPLGVQVELVPRYFEVIGPSSDIDPVEGLPLVCLGSPRISRSSRVFKRMIDLVGGSIALVLAAPAMIAIAIAIKRDSPGPILFRQIRLGESMREFTNLKFRTMRIGTTQEVHREYIRATTNSSASPEATGLYKLDRSDEVTHVGRWLRQRSLDELPQLLNVIRGDLSLVGPRPCIPYEVEFFEMHHFDRFLVPAGITGLWQVTARARSTFGEALDLDVAYVRSYSLWRDVQLILRTPVQLFRQRVTA